MSAPAPPPSADGTFAPVEFERAVRVEDEIDLQELDDQEQSVVQADDFTVFGLANIEQWNDPAPGESDLFIEMDALEQNLEQLLALQNISVGHRDVRVGEPLESYTFESDATVHIDADRTLTFEAGDTVRTEVIREGEPLPGDNGTADEDALWLAANIFGRDDPRGSKFSQKIRLASYYGDVDGFSVTIDKKDWTENQSGGVRVHDLDFLAVTVGDDEDIKNPGSSFGVAEFQASAGFGGTLADVYGLRPRPDTGSAGRQPRQQTQTLKSQLMTGIINRLIGSGKQTLATQAVEQAIQTETSIEQQASELADGENVTEDELVAQAEGVTEELEDGAREIAEQAEDEDMDGDAVEDMAADLADELGVDKEVVMAMVEEAKDMTDEMDEEPGDNDMEQQEANEEVWEAVEVIAGGSDMDEEEIMDALGLDESETEGDYEDDEDDMEEQSDDGTPDVQGMIEQAVAEQMDDDTGGDDGEYVTEEQLDARLSEFESSVESQLSDISDTVADDLADSIESQMETGATPGPSGGGVDNEDMESAIDNLADDLGMEVSD